MTLEQKVELVRKNVISAVQKYKNELVGKKFLYIFGNEFIEVIYKTENFMHLTGIDSKKLKPQKFYDKTKDKTLKRNNMFFSSRYPLKTAMEKSNELSNIDIFSNSKISIIKDMQTSTYAYEFGFSDKKMTLGLIKNTREDIKGNKIELDYYVPQTFRVKEDATKGKDPSEIIEIAMILSKTDVKAKYNKIHYGDEKQIESLPDKIKKNISENLIYSKSKNKEIEVVLTDETTELDKNLNIIKRT